MNQIAQATSLSNGLKIGKRCRILIKFRLHCLTKIMMSKMIHSYLQMSIQLKSTLINKIENPRQKFSNKSVIKMRNRSLLTPSINHNNKITIWMSTALKIPLGHSYKQKNNHLRKQIPSKTLSDYLVRRMKLMTRTTLIINI